VLLLENADMAMRHPEHELRAAGHAVCAVEPRTPSSGARGERDLGRWLAGRRTAVPVSCSVHDRRSSPGAHRCRRRYPLAGAGRLVADPASNWSVIVLGGRELAAPTPGAGDDAQIEFTVDADLVTGRRFGAA
jgi:hypothetical protein